MFNDQERKFRGFLGGSFSLLNVLEQLQQFHDFKKNPIKNNPIENNPIKSNPIKNNPIYLLEMNQK